MLTLLCLKWRLHVFGAWQFLSNTAVVSKLNRKLDRLKVVLKMNLKCYFQSIEFFRVAQPLNRVFDSCIRMNLVRLARSLDPRSNFPMNGNSLSVSTSTSSKLSILYWSITTTIDKKMWANFLRKWFLLFCVSGFLRWCITTLKSHPLK